MYQSIVIVTTKDNDGFCHEYPFVINSKSNPNELDLFSMIHNKWINLISINEKIIEIQTISNPEIINSL